MHALDEGKHISFICYEREADLNLGRPMLIKRFEMARTRLRSRRQIVPPEEKGSPTRRFLFLSAPARDLETLARVSEIPNSYGRSIRRQHGGLSRGAPDPADLPRFCGRVSGAPPDDFLLPPRRAAPHQHPRAAGFFQDLCPGEEAQGSPRFPPTGGGHPQAGLADEAPDQGDRRRRCAFSC